MPVKQLLSYGSSKKARKPPVIHETPLYLSVQVCGCKPVRQTASAVSGLLWPPRCPCRALPEKAAGWQRGCVPKVKDLDKVKGLDAPVHPTGGLEVVEAILQHICARIRYFHLLSGVLLLSFMSSQMKCVSTGPFSYSLQASGGKYPRVLPTPNAVATEFAEKDLG